MLLLNREVVLKKLYIRDIRENARRRVSRELFLTKGVPQLISAGFEFLRKFVLAWRFSCLSNTF